MIRTFAPIASLLFSVALLMVGHGLQSTIVPLASKGLAFADFSIGLAASGYFAGFVVGGIIAPHVVVRAGHIRGFAVMVSSMSAAALLHPLISDEYAWILFRLMTGFSVAGLYLIIESWLNEFADNANRGLVMSAYVIVNYAAFTVGQLLATIAEPEAFFLFAIASIIISVAVVPVAMTKAAQPAPMAVVKLELRKVFRVSPAAIVAAICVGVVQGSHLSFAAIYAVDKGYNSLSQAPIFAAILGVGGIVGQWPIGRISDYFDRRLVLIIISLFGIAGSVAITSVGATSFALLLIVGFFIGAMIQPAYSLAIAHGYDHASESGYVRMAAGLLVAFGIGSSIGPTVTALAMRKWGPEALFLLPALVLAILCVYLAFRIMKSEAIESDDKDDYEFASTSAAVGAVVTPELLNEDDKYVVVPDEWEPSEEDDSMGSDGKEPEGLEEPEETGKPENMQNSGPDGAHTNGMKDYPI
ncbi:MAG: MFS transporter [Cohaesibacter sp.]|nr:MFS transporter [Cohaesibacter sp.]